MRSSRTEALDSLRTSRMPAGTTRSPPIAPDPGCVQILTPSIFCSPSISAVRQLARALLDCARPILVWNFSASPNADHRRLVALPESLERPRDADAPGIRAEDARPDLRLRALVDVEHAVLFRPARPLVRAAAVEVRLDVAQIDVEQAERLRAVDERQDAALARQRDRSPSPETDRRPCWSGA